MNVSVTVADNDAKVLTAAHPDLAAWLASLARNEARGLRQKTRSLTVKTLLSNDAFIDEVAPIAEKYLRAEPKP